MRTTTANARRQPGRFTCATGQPSIIRPDEASLSSTTAICAIYIQRVSSGFKRTAFYAMLVM